MKQFDKSFNWQVYIFSVELKKTLGLFDALSIGIGAIVGAGIFVVTGIAAGIIGYQELAASGSPLADVAMSESKNAANLISVGALAATLSVLLTTLLGLSRISFAMAENRDLPS